MTHSSGCKQMADFYDGVGCGGGGKNDHLIIRSHSAWYGKSHSHHSPNQ